MPFRARFDCLWCGTGWTVRSPGDLEGWAQLCPTCLGRAGDNTFLRARLRAALEERAGSPSEAVAAAPAAPAARAGPVPRGAGTRPRGTDASPHRVGAPPPALPDDWFLRRGPFERGAIHDAAWAAELDMVTRWLDAQPLAGRIAEPAAGVGFFSPLLASKGELHASDPDGAALDRARDRLLAHGLRAHLHEDGPWSPPVPGEPPADALVAAFVVGRVGGAGLDAALAALRARLRPGARLALVDLRADAGGGPPDGIPWTYHEPAILEAALARAGFVRIELATTGRFFLTASAEAA